MPEADDLYDDADDLCDGCSSTWTLWIPAWTGYEEPLVPLLDAGLIVVCESCNGQTLGIVLHAAEDVPAEAICSALLEVAA